MLAATTILSVASLTGMSGLSEQFDNAADKTAKKMDLSEQMALSVSQMLSLERGVLVRTAMNDLPKAEGYHNQFLE